MQLSANFLNEVYRHYSTEVDFYAWIDFITNLLAVPPELSSLIWDHPKYLMNARAYKASSLVHLAFYKGMSGREVYAKTVSG